MGQHHQANQKCPHHTTTHHPSPTTGPKGPLCAGDRSLRCPFGCSGWLVNICVCQDFLFPSGGTWPVSGCCAVLQRVADPCSSGVLGVIFFLFFRCDCPLHPTHPVPQQPFLAVYSNGWMRRVPIFLPDLTDRPLPPSPTAPAHGVIPARSLVPLSLSDPPSAPKAQAPRSCRPPSETRWSPLVLRSHPGSSKRSHYFLPVRRPARCPPPSTFVSSAGLFYLLSSPSPILPPSPCPVLISIIKSHRIKNLPSSI